jgi:hypothetical protein
MPSTCDPNTIFGCSFPYFIGLLVFLLVFLVALRLALPYLGNWGWLWERWRAPPKSAPSPKAPPKFVPVGSPLHPSPAKEQKKPAPAPAAPPQPAKPTPLQFTFKDRPDLKPTDFPRGGAQGDFGEMLTNIILAQDGWKKLPSKFLNGHGIGGLFAREVRGGGGYEILAVETRTNNGAFDPAAMSDVKLARDISELFEAGALSKPMAEELIRGLTNGPPFFRKELWRHDLSSGVLSVVQLVPNGEQKAGASRSYARLMASAYMSLKQMDRDSIYIGQKAVDQSDG